MLFQLKLLKGVNSLSQLKLSPNEVQFLQDTLITEFKVTNIRLREGEYQHDLAKAIASYQLELQFPHVKDIIQRLYGEEKIKDIAFIRKIQTILKKMERNNVVKILPKGKPWALQRYVLSSFSFEDVDKNRVSFATEEQIVQMQDLLLSIGQQGQPTAKLATSKTKIFALVAILIASYAAVLWDLMQPIITPILFIPGFSLAVICSLMLGRTLSRQ